MFYSRSLQWNDCTRHEHQWAHSHRMPRLCGWVGGALLQRLALQVSVSAGHRHRTRNSRRTEREPPERLDVVQSRRRSRRDFPTRAQWHVSAFWAARVLPREAEADPLGAQSRRLRSFDSAAGIRFIRFDPVQNRKCFRRLLVVSSMFSIIQVKLMLTILIKWF